MAGEGRSRNLAPAPHVLSSMPGQSSPSHPGSQWAATQPPTCTTPVPAHHAGNSPPHLPCVRFQSLSILHSQPTDTPPFPTPAASMLVEATAVSHLNTCTSRPPGCPLYSVVPVCYIFTRVDFKKCRCGHVTPGLQPLSGLPLPVVKAVILAGPSILVSAGPSPISGLFSGPSAYLLTGDFQSRASPRTRFS